MRVICACDSALRRPRLPPRRSARTRDAPAKAPHGRRGRDRGQPDCLGRERSQPPQNPGRENRAAKARDVHVTVYPRRCRPTWTRRAARRSSEACARRPGPYPNITGTLMSSAARAEREEPVAFEHGVVQGARLDRGRGRAPRGPSPTSSVRCLLPAERVELRSAPSGPTFRAGRASTPQVLRIDHAVHVCRIVRARNARRTSRRALCQIAMERGLCLVRQVIGVHLDFRA